MATPKTGGGLKLAGPTKKAPPKKGGSKNSSGLPLLKYGGDITAGTIDAPQISNDPFDFTDTSFDIPDVSAGTVSSRDISAGTVTAGTVESKGVTAGSLADRFMTTADYSMVDPTEIAKQYGDINRDQIRQNSDLSSELALKQLDTELQGLKNFTPAAAALKRAEIANDNQFNQGQRDAQLDATDPGIRKDLMAQRERAQAYAEGRVPDSIGDRSLELGIRSRAADAASAGGFGVKSSAARKASELMSVENRIKLSEMGDRNLTDNIKNRSSLLFADTQYSDAGSKIDVNSRKSGAELAAANLTDMNSYTNISSEKALTNLTQQEQYKTTNQQETNKFNTDLAATRDFNQANLNLDADKFTSQQDLLAQSTNVENTLRADTTNVTNQLSADESNATRSLQADTTNAGNQLNADLANQSTSAQTQIAGRQIQSNEKQSAAQLDWNTKNSNAQRTFEASTENVSNALKVADSNRTTRMDVQKTNANMIFQDQQARKSEAAANARAAASERGANARAAMGYAAQSAAAAAGLAAKEKELAFNVAQQDKYTAAYQEAMKKGQSAADAQAAGNAAARIPTVLAGIGTTVTSLVTAGKDLVAAFTPTPAKPEPTPVSQPTSYPSSSSTPDMFSSKPNASTPGATAVGTNLDGSTKYI